MAEGPSRARNLGRLTLAAAALGLAVVLGLLSGMVSRGFGELEAARRERRSLEAERSRLEHRVRVLQEILERLEEDPTATEALARRELGWVRPGETVIYLATPTPAAVAVPLTQPTPTPILSFR